MTNFSIDAILADTKNNRESINEYQQMPFNGRNDGVIADSTENSFDSENISSSSSGGSLDELSSDDNEGSIEGSEVKKPGYTYAAMIMMAIRDSSHQRLTLHEIYEYIMNRFPFFKRHQTQWQNSVRHTLSLNKCFVKIPRSYDNPGRGNYWGLDKAAINMVIGEDTGRLRYQNNFGQNIPKMVSGNYPGNYLVGNHGGYCHMPLHESGLISSSYTYPNGGHLGISGIQHFPGISAEEFQHYMNRCAHMQQGYRI